MSVLTCDVCGGNLTIDAGGKTATCEFCNAKHTMERLKEKVMEIKGSVQIDGAVQASQTGTADDIRQWKMLVNKYMGAYDYQAAMPIVNKILEADPTDKETNILYDELQILKYLDIRDGVLVGYSGKVEKLKIPSGIKKIGERAFEKCDSLVKLEFDENSEVEIIDERAFSQCKCLKWVDLSNCKKLAMIGERAFYFDGELENVILPDGLSTLAHEVFANDAKLNEIVLPQKLIRMGNRVFAGCHSLGKIEFYEKSDLETIGNEAFSGCSCIKLVDLSACEKLKIIGEKAFSDNKKLEQVILPDGLNTLAHSVFENDIKLYEIILPQKLERIGNRVFAGCHSLKKLDIPNSILYMGGAIFMSSGIEDLRLPQQVNRVNIVHGCEKLTILNASIDFKKNYRECYMEEYGDSKKSYRINKEYTSVWNKTMDEKKKRNMCEYCGQKIPLMKRTCPSCHNKVRLIKIK